MGRAGKSGGICRACRGEEKCQHARTPDRPVQQCEEFEPCDCLPCKTPSRSCSGGQEREGVVAGCDGTDARGLCVNCDNRRACGFPKPPGGVWHCDEYR